MEYLSIQNQGEEVPPTARLLTVLKAKTTDLVAVKHNKFANLHLMVQHRKERKMLTITSDISIEKLKELCFVGNVTLSQINMIILLFF